MQDWKKLLRTIYSPDIGSLWAVPNSVWDNGFASTQARADLHPALLERYTPCKTITYIIPGTTKSYNQGSCVFRIKINPTKTNESYSHFLIKLSMPFTKAKLIELQQSWNGIDSLDDKQLQEFKMQVKFCRG